MPLTVPLYDDMPCECGFLLRRPIARSRFSSLGFYDDARFPGRMILKLNTHYDALDRLPLNLLTGFMQDAQYAMNAVRKATGAVRVNFAVLGDREPHVHAHLVPRFTHDMPDGSPWDDPRPKEELEGMARANIMDSILDELVMKGIRDHDQWG